MEAIGLVDRPFGQASPGAGRPSLKDGEEGDVVRVALVGLDVHRARRLGHHGEGLKGHAAFQKSGDVDMPPPSSSEQVPAPEEGIGVEVGHQQGRMKSARLGGHRRQRAVQRAVHPAGDDGGCDAEGQEGQGAEGSQEGDQDAPAPGAPGPAGAPGAAWAAGDAGVVGAAWAAGDAGTS